MKAINKNLIKIVILDMTLILISLLSITFIISIVI